MTKTNEAFKIYVDQLHNGNVEIVHEKFSVDFLDVQEAELQFTGEVAMDGEAYLATDTLVLHFSVVAHAILPCAMCNRPVTTDIQITDYYHIEPLSDVKSGIFNFEEILRETILLETPAFAECNEGHCTSRKEMKKYLKNPGESSPDDEGHQPFANLN